MGLRPTLAPARESSAYDTRRGATASAVWHEDTEWDSGEWSGGRHARQQAWHADVWMEDEEALGSIPTASLRDEQEFESAVSDGHVPVARRIAQASVRLAELGRQRPAVRISAPGRGSNSHAARRSFTAKLPPIWLLANLAIVLAIGVAVLPRMVTADAAAGCRWHAVVPGDTLGNLGWANHTSALALARANHISNPNLIYVGQNLCIPLTSGAQAKTAPAVPAASQPPKFGTATGVKKFVEFALPYARKAHQQTGWPVSLILAQWGLEQGWHVPSYTGYNWGNVAALPGEPTVHGTAAPGSPSAFAYARTPDDGLRYYVRVAHVGYYKAVAPTAAKYGPDAAARALGQSPWDAAHYTSIHSPGSSLINLMRVYNLYWYDTH